MFELTGKIKVIQPTQKINERFKKREFVIEENSSQYPQVVPFEFTQDKCDVLDNYKVGQDVKVFFNIRGREWTNNQNETKYFLNLNAWKMEALGAGSSTPPPSEVPPYEAASHSIDDAPSDEDEVLPF